MRAMTQAIRRQIATLRRRGSAGFMSFDTMLAVAIVAIILGVMYQIVADMATTQQNSAVSQRMKAIEKAVKKYVPNNYATIDSAISPGGLALPVVNGPTPASLDSIKDAGYLPQSFQDRNPYGQKEWVLIRDIGASGKRFDVMIVTTGGSAISFDDNIARLAASIGAEGGFVIDEGPYNSNTVYGAYGGWESSVSNWNSATDASGSTHAPTPGHITASLGFNMKGTIKDYLYRRDIPGDTVGGGRDELNAMRTTLYMNGGGTRHNIENVKNVDAQDFRFDSYTGSDGERQTASEGSFYQSVVKNGDTVDKPNCPSGKSPQIFTSAMSFADENGYPVHGVDTWAVDNGGNWGVRMAVATQPAGGGGALDWGPPAGGDGHNIKVVTKCE